MSSENAVFDEKHKIWGSIEHQTSYAPSNFGQMILNALSKYGSHLAQVIEIKF